MNMRLSWEGIMYINDTVNRLKRHFKKYSIVLKDKDRNLTIDALLQIAGALALLEEIKNREYPIDTEQIERRLELSFKQLFLKYRKHFPEIEGMTDDSNQRFFWISPTGEVKINRRVYNVPKKHSEVGFVPSLLLQAWVLRRYPEKWDKPSKK